MENLDRRFIAVTNRHLCKEDFLSRIEVLSKTDVQSIILREKDLSEAEYLELAKKVLEICRAHNKKLILHNFSDCAIELKSDGLHLPFSVFLETDVEKLKAQFSEIGTSVHSIEDALLAQEKGATYITYGHIFETDCKKGLEGRGLESLRKVCSSVEIPVYAIGGISVENIDSVLECGAKAGCVMSGCMK